MRKSKVVSHNSFLLFFRSWANIAKLPVAGIERLLRHLEVFKVRKFRKMISELMERALAFVHDNPGLTIREKGNTWSLPPHLRAKPSPYMRGAT
jgi:hypothetical protein